jgi:hypothetical protein
MTLILELPEKLEAALKSEALRRDVPAQEIVLLALDRELTLPKTPQAVRLAVLMEKWNKEMEDPANHESFDNVFVAMDEARVGQRKLFPAELKGVTW